MLCAELERLEAEFDDILTELEKEGLTDTQKKELQRAYVRLSRTINDHHARGHDGAPCFEE